MIYLDNNATTPILPEVKEEIIKTIDFYGNPSSLHQLGREVRERIEGARSKIAKFINSGKDNIIFTSGGSEANNTVLNSFVRKYKDKAKILVSKIEHSSVLEHAKFLSREYEVDYIEVDSKGKIILEDIEKKLKTSKKTLISVMITNNEIGIVQDMKEIINLSRKYGAVIHSDAVQAFGKIKIDVEELDVDYMTFSGHKINAPKGIGAIYFKNKDIIPLIHGGHQEMGLRSGTENTIGIIAFGKAVEIRERDFDFYIKKTSALRERLIKGITEIPDVIVNTDLKNSVPNTLNVSFKGVEGESIMLYLDLEGIEVSTGSACSSGELEPSHVLLAIGREPELAHGSIRFSLGLQNTEEEIDYTVEKLKNIISKLRQMSTVY